MHDAERPNLETDTAIALDLEPKEGFYERVRVEIARDKARTESRLATILVCALVVSLPVYYFAVWATPTLADSLSDAMDKWFTVMGPLAGAAVGVGYLRESRNQSESRP